MDFAFDIESGLISMKAIMRLKVIIGVATDMKNDTTQVGWGFSLIQAPPTVASKKPAGSNFQALPGQE